jgi:hypothetical protein
MAKRVQAMAAGRLPKLVVDLGWGSSARRGRPRKLWAGRSKANLTELKIDDATIQNCDCNKTAFKTIAMSRTAERDEANMKEEATKRNTGTVAAYLDLDDSSLGKKMRLRPYFDGGHERGAQLMFQCRASCLLLNNYTAGWSREATRLLDDGNLDVEGAKACQCCDKNVEENLIHFLLECPQYDGSTSYDRKAFLGELKDLVGGVLFGKFEALTKAQKVQKLLGRGFWGELSLDVHKLLQRFLVSAWGVREKFYSDRSAGGNTGRVANGLPATAHN